MHTHVHTYVHAYVHTHIHTHNHFTALWILSRTTWGSQYPRRNIHPLTPIMVINQPLSASSISYDPWQPLCSIYVPGSLFPQSLSKFSLVYLLAWHPPLHTPYISSPNQSSFRSTCPYHHNLFCCSTEIMSSNPSFYLNPLLGTLSNSYGQLMPLPLTNSCCSKSRLVLPFWCRLTRVILDKIQAGCKMVVCMCVCKEFSLTILPTLSTYFQLVQKTSHIKDTIRHKYTDKNVLVNITCWPLLYITPFVHSDVITLGIWTSSDELR